MTDASFADGVENPLRLMARDGEDIAIVSTMIQDAIAERKEMLFEADRNCFSLLLKRFRWEDVNAAKTQDRPYERVQTVLMVQSVTQARFTGFDAHDQELVFDLIGLQWSPEDELGGKLHIIFAGNGEIILDCECVDLILSDMSRPYVAKSQLQPDHQGE